MAKIVVVDDHRIFREGICSLMEQTGQDEVVADLDGLEDIDHILDSLAPNILILDLSLEDGLAFSEISRLKENHPEIRIVVLSMHGDQASVDKAIASGADSYALKRDAFQDLVFAIRVAERGGQFISPTIIKENKNTSEDTKFEIENLPTRQHQILILVQRGKSNKEIAAELELALPTVKNHLSVLYRKFGVVNRVSLLAKFRLTDLHHGK